MGNKMKRENKDRLKFPSADGRWQIRDDSSKSDAEHARNYATTIHTLTTRAFVLCEKGIKRC